jgi:hypothetical protein
MDVVTDVNDVETFRDTDEISGMWLRIEIRSGLGTVLIKDTERGSRHVSLHGCMLHRLGWLYNELSMGKLSGRNGESSEHCMATRDRRHS